MEIKEVNGRLEVDLPAVLDLPAAADLRDTLLDALARDSAAEVALKAGAVERLSTACVQVVLAAAAGFAAAARHIEIDGPSEAMVLTFRHLGLAAELEKLT
ncbi:MAG: STAS domain-containing protein [Actinomycetota bacterium]